MNYTDEQAEAMYLDWFNNFLSCDAWRQYYQLGMAEGENILDRGRRLNHKRQLTNDNKVIAEFMGIRNYKQGRYLMFEYADNNHRTEQDLAYHTSWDWLMPVVERIEAELEEEFRVVILEHECSIHQKTEDQKLQIAFQCVAETFGISKIQATYEAVVEFIKQYNDGE